VVAGQRLIQGAPDILLGWGEVSGIQLYVRQMRDMKGGIEFEPARTPTSSSTAPSAAGRSRWRTPSPATPR
jgi:hypothetical protein